MDQPSVAHLYSAPQEVTFANNVRSWEYTSRVQMKVSMR